MSCFLNFLWFSSTAYKGLPVSATKQANVSPPSSILNKRLFRIREVVVSSVGTKQTILRSLMLTQFQYTQMAITRIPLEIQHRYLSHPLKIRHY
jgi:hypothetical protein